MTTTDHVAQHLNGVGLVVLLVRGWGLDDGNVVIEVPADVFLEEFLWGDVGVAVVLVILLGPVLKVEVLDRFAKGVGQHPVNLIQHLLPGRGQLRFASAVIVDHSPQDDGVVAQLVVQDVVDSPGVAGVKGLRHG